MTIVDGRQIVGRFLAFDRHMNLVLADSEEFRRINKSKKSSSANDKDEKEDVGEVRRVLGFVLLRGEEVVSVAVEGPPIRVKKQKAQEQAGGGAMMPGQGIARAAGRGMPPPGMMPQGGGLGGQPGMMQPPPGFMPPPGFRHGMQ